MIFSSQNDILKTLMKLLFITRKVDKADSNAGFIYTWIKRIGERLDKLIVICQEAGDYSGLPGNIEINSLGKEIGYNKLKQFIKFQSLVMSRLSQVDGVFAHMMPVYSILAGPWCKLFRKKLIQWYTHKSVDFKLKLANLAVDNFATASKESFRLKTTKPVKILGHGIDTKRFAPRNKKQDTRNKQSSKLVFNIISIGRVSPTKDYESMIKAVYELKQSGVKNIQLTIIGDVGLKSQQIYFDNLKQMVKKMNLESQVQFLGSIANLETPKYLQQSDLFINLSDTGSLDKALLEAMACENLVLTSNQAFKSILSPELIVAKDQPDMLAEKIKYIINLPTQEKSKLRKELRKIVVENHNLDELVSKIIGLYK